MKNNRTFLEKLLDGAEVEWKTLDEISSIYGGLTGKGKADFENGNALYVPYKNIFNNIEVDFNNLEAVNVSDDERQYTIKYGDVLFTGSSETAEEAGMSSAVTTKTEQKIYLNSFSFGLRFNDDVELLPEFSKFLFRTLSIRKEIVKSASGVTRFNISKARFKKIKIPIPPLPVQTEIVKILDALTALTSSLTSSLTSELTLRRKQYEYYREKLLSFDSLEQLNMGGAKKKLIDVAKIKNGKDWKHLGEGDIPIYGSGGIMGYVDTYSYNKPTVLIPRKGSITNIFYLEEPFWNVDTIYYTEINTTQILPKYFFHFMKTVDLAKLDTGSGRPSLTQAILNEIPIFVPSIEEQQRIVSILDKFEDLTNSITDGLPLAIEQSQKRYEYYRELLLNFS